MVLNKKINAQNMTNWRSEALLPERVHVQVYPAKGWSYEISLVPSKTLDTHLSPSEFVNTVATIGSRRHGQRQAVLPLWSTPGCAGVTLPILHGWWGCYDAA